MYFPESIPCLTLLDIMVIIFLSLLSTSICYLPIGNMRFSHRMSSSTLGYLPRISLALLERGSDSKLSRTKVRTSFVGMLMNNLARAMWQISDDLHNVGKDLYIGWKITQSEYA